MFGIGGTSVVRKEGDYVIKKYKSLKKWVSEISAFIILHEKMPENYPYLIYPVEWNYKTLEIKMPYVGKTLNDITELDPRLFYDLMGIYELNFRLKRNLGIYIHDRNFRNWLYQTRSTPYKNRVKIGQTTYEVELKYLITEIDINELRPVKDYPDDLFRFASHYFFYSIYFGLLVWYNDPEFEEYLFNYRKNMKPKDKKKYYELYLYEKDLYEHLFVNKSQKELDDFLKRETLYALLRKKYTHKDPTVETLPPIKKLEPLILAWHRRKDICDSWIVDGSKHKKNIKKNKQDTELYNRFCAVEKEISKSFKKKGKL